MNKTVLLGAALVVLAGLGYYQFSMAPAQRAADEAAASAKTAADEAAAAAKAAEEATAAAAAEAAKAAEEAAKAVEDAAKTAAEAATKAATEAVGAVTEAVTGAAESAGDTAAMVWDATKLTSEEIIARIEAAPVSDTVKQTLTATYNGVKDNAAGVQMVLDQLKTAMGL
jgi:colicin import membrane protein